MTIPAGARDDQAALRGSHDMSQAASTPTEPFVDTVEVFWRPGCPFCMVLRTDLTRRGIDALWRNIWEDDDARATVRGINGGNETVPTVRVGSVNLTNPSGAEVEDAVWGRHGSVARRRRFALRSGKSA